MLIQLLEDRSYDLNELPDEVDEIRYAILDNSDPSEPDFKFPQMIFLETFTSPALILRIGKYKIKMPLDWQIVIGEEDCGDIESLPLTSINDRDFSAFVFNSLSSFSAEFLPIEILDVYNNVEWYFPKLKQGQFLSVPIEEGNKPKCVYFIKDVSRNSEVIQYNDLW